MKHIKLNIKDKSLISLSGRPFGIEIYNTQIADKIEGESEVILEFPPQIRSFASSFPQGLLASEIEKLGLENVKKKFKIHSEFEGLEKDFWESFD
ncbi:MULTISPECIES: hypothetical protein [Streptococcus]|jgi:hypothetical protein|uniref:hypothetical protein n=1 Tax=Streptococcus TaxID=1301 RepID=UPI002001B1E6|nr:MULTISPECIES: hypothetical protein [Streptococcus]